MVYVENPIERLEGALASVKEWDDSEPYAEYLKELLEFNKVVTENDLPEFYDPIEIEEHKDNLDSYNFNSIYNFMMDKDKREKFLIKEEGEPLLRKILVAWLARILSERLLA